VENYISQKNGKDLTNVFDQYLRTTKIPLLEYRRTNSSIQYRWSNTPKVFTMPLQLSNGQWIHPSTAWQTLKLKTGMSIVVDPNYYIAVKKL
jgi:aminopeptidase N